jgi:ABC-type multidrug transport system fused ATPase/permease subunit
MTQSAVSDSLPARTLESEALFELCSRPSQLASLTLGVVAYSVGHAAMAASAGLLAHKIAGGSAGHGLDGVMAAKLWKGSLTTLAYVGLVAAFVKAGTGAYLARAERQLAASVAGRLRVTLVGGMLRNGLSLPAPRALAAIAVRLRDVESAVTEGVLTGWRAAVQLVPLALCLVALSSRLAVLAAVCVVPFVVAVAALRGRARLANEQAQSLVERLEQGVDELVRNADLFRTYGAGERALAAIDRAGVEAGASAAKVEMGRALLSGANEAMAALAILGVVAVSDRLGVALPKGALLPFATVFFMAYRPLRDLGDARGWVTRGNVALEAVRLAVSPPKNQVPFEAPSPDVWTDAPPIVELVAFGALGRGPRTTARFEPGEIVALVGPTGSGKTTLFRALLGLEPATGRLLSNNRDMTTRLVGPRDRPFAWVPQEAPLVTGTLAENVLLMGGTEADARAALGLVGAERLARTVDRVGPGGRPLSGGERRQVSLARALVTGLPVLLLDEPTEGLDAESARAVRDAIVRLRGTRTVVVATHRDDVVAIADRVVHVGGEPGAATLAAE